MSICRRDGVKECKKKYCKKVCILFHWLIFLTNHLVNERVCSRIKVLKTSNQGIEVTLYNCAKFKYLLTNTEIKYKYKYI